MANQGEVQNSADGDLKLTSATDKSFINYFRSLPAKSDVVLRIFDRGGDYYTMHEDDAMLVAKEVLRSTAAIKQIGPLNNQLTSLGLGKTIFERVLSELLLVRKYKIEIWRNASVGSHTKWEVQHRASPGNLSALEDVLYSQNDISEGAGLMCIKSSFTGDLKTCIVSVCYCDVTLRDLGLSSFPDHTEHYANIESLIVQMKPREVILFARTDQDKLKKSLMKFGLMVTSLPAKNLSANDGERALLMLVSDRTATARITEQGSNTALCLAGVVCYLDLLSRTDDMGKFNLISIDLDQYLQLDAAATRALSIEPAVNEMDLGRAGSLTCLLDYCRTPQGKRLLRTWIRQPLLDKRRIEERHNLVEIFFRDVALRETMVNSQLRHFPDFYKWSRKLQIGKGTLQDCFKIYIGVKHLPELLAIMEFYDGDHKGILLSTKIEPLRDLIIQVSKLPELIETTIDMDKTTQHEYLVKSSMDQGLADLDAEIEHLMKEINKQLHHAARDLQLEAGKGLKIENNSILGYYLKLTKKEGNLIQDNNKYRLLEARKDGIRFTTTYLQELSNEHATIHDKYLKLQATIANKVIQIVAGYHEPLLAINDLIAQLDVLNSFATASISAPIPYCRPTILEQCMNTIELDDARHPCLELQSSVSFIPNDVKLNKNIQNFLIITGPNMGGKSTYIRQVGVIVLLAQIGCFVPCSRATISIVDRILARVGASDSQLRGVSTFMSEMMETAIILQCASESSLIIIDELGRGTSTHDGFGLAWSISHHIATKIGCYCLFATHFHELTDLSQEVAAVANYHVTALTTEDSFTLLYKVKPGPSDQSFGVHVAKLADFSKHVIDMANKKTLDLEAYNMNKLLREATPFNIQIKNDRAEGEQIIRYRLRQYMEIDEDRMTDEQIQEALNSLKFDLQNSSNAYVRFRFKDLNF